MAKRSQIRSGSLKDVIVIQRQVQSSTGRANEALMEWATFRTVFSEVEAKSGNELLQAAQRVGNTQGQIYARTVMRFRCRHGDVVGVTPDMRISFESALYDIKAILPDYAGKAHILIEAESVV
jgi:head-tail adaptor